MFKFEIKEAPNKMLKFKESVPYVSLPPTQPPRHLLVTSATAWPSSRAPFQAAFWWIGTIVRGTSGQVWEYCSSILLCLDQALNSCPSRLSSREKRNIAQRCARVTLVSVECLDIISLTNFGRKKCCSYYQQFWSMMVKVLVWKALVWRNYQDG